MLSTSAYTASMLLPAVLAEVTGLATSTNGLAPPVGGVATPIGGVASCSNTSICAAAASAKSIVFKLSDISFMILNSEENKLVG